MTRQQPFFQRQRRRLTTLMMVTVYLWSILFVAFAHNHPGNPYLDGAGGVEAAMASPTHTSASAATERGKTLPHALRRRASPPDTCIACIWDSTAGSAMVSVPTLPLTASAADPASLARRCVAHSCTRSYRSRAPPAR